MALGWGFKEILWDSGAIWIVIILMFTTWIIKRAQIMINQYAKKKERKRRMLR
jgi:hypothetical protein